MLGLIELVFRNAFRTEPFRRSVRDRQLGLSNDIVFTGYDHTGLDRNLTAVLGIAHGELGLSAPVLVASSGVPERAYRVSARVGS